MVLLHSDSPVNATFSEGCFLSRDQSSKGPKRAPSFLRELRAGAAGAGSGAGAAGPAVQPQTRARARAPPCRLPPPVRQSASPAFSPVPHMIFIEGHRRLVDMLPLSEANLSLI